jgi:hypothetical protein
MDLDVSIVGCSWCTRVLTFWKYLDFTRPFDYPEHSYIPYSIERECMKTRYVDSEGREDRLFILAKSTEYFNEPFTGIPRSFWAGLEEQTNLSAISTAMDDPNLVKEGSHIFGVPEGIESIGEVSKGEFEIQLARAKLMLGIGRPYISPSVYSSLYVLLGPSLPFKLETLKRSCL